MTRKNTGIIRKRDGFNGQKSIGLPKPIIKRSEQNSLINGLHLTNIGFYPKAQFHYREREHGSPQNILIYCVDGRGWANVNGREIEISPGEYLIIPEKEKHKYGADNQQPWSIYWVHFTGKNGVDFVKLLKRGEASLSASISYSEDRIHLFNNIYNTLEKGYSLDNLVYVNLLLNCFLASFCFPQLYHVPAQKMQGGIDIVIEFMQTHIQQTVSLQELSELIHISPSHFSALFKRKTGYSPLEYFTHLKIQKACQYLEFTDMHIKEISYLFGFADPFYFSRLFSKYMGVSPLEYRKRKQY